MAGGNALILGKDNGTFNYLDENGGFIVDYELENITQILVKLLGNRILLKKMGKYNLDKVQKHFHSTKVSKTFLDYLTK
jgi:hypothetical protein